MNKVKQLIGSSDLVMKKERVTKVNDNIFLKIAEIYVFPDFKQTHLSIFQFKTTK